MLPIGLPPLKYAQMSCEFILIKIPLIAKNVFSDSQSIQHDL